MLGVLECGVSHVLFDTFLVGFVESDTQFGCLSAEEVAMQSVRFDIYILTAMIRYVSLCAYVLEVNALLAIFFVCFISPISSRY